MENIVTHDPKRVLCRISCFMGKIPPNKKDPWGLKEVLKYCI